MAESTTSAPDHEPLTGGPVNDALGEPEQHVLSTMERDGSRRWLRPRLSTGNWWHRRRAVAYVLMVVFVAVPHIRVFGKSLLLIDIPGREFTIFGRTFLPTDTLLLALLLLSVVITIVLLTAITGRVWCGWACPQTVYMEYLFRPIDRLFEGTKGKGGKPKAEMTGLRQGGRLVVYMFLCMFLAHTFLAYFVAPEQLSQWVRSSPLDHPMAFIVMASTMGLMMFDFMYFREQMCVIACPYGRLQSVMLDEQSTIVAYDRIRGEPRKKGKHQEGEAVGDCVDCHRCVVVCPTGIDIRNGLQMECISCTQCVDACDEVMDRVGSPRGLIRYSSQAEIAGKPHRRLRPRTIIYPLILIVVVSTLLYALTTSRGFDALVVRGKGNPFTPVERGVISNTFNIRLVNRTDESQQYEMSISSPDGVRLEVIDPAALSLAAGENSVAPIRVLFSGSLTYGDGRERASLRVSDGNENVREVDFTLMGPKI